MVALFVVAGLIAYFTVGGILSGILCEDDKLGLETLMMWFLWPVVLISSVFVIAMAFPFELGRKLKERRWRRR